MHEQEQNMTYERDTEGILIRKAFVKFIMVS